MTVIGPVLFEICSGNEVCVKTMIGHSSEPKVGQSSYTPKGTTRPPRGVVWQILRQSDKYFQRYAPETKCSRTAQRHNIIIFSSATLPIEFRLKIFKPVYYPPGSSPHTEKCYPSLFSCKVIGKRRGKKQNGGGIHSSLRLTYGDGGSSKMTTFQASGYVVLSPAASLSWPVKKSENGVKKYILNDSSSTWRKLNVVFWGGGGGGG